MLDYQPKTGKRGLTAGAAILASVVLHFALIEWLPAIPVGTIPGLKAPDREMLPAMHVEEVRSFQQMPKYPELDKYIPTDPDRVADLAKELEGFESAPDLSPLDEPVVESKPLEGESKMTADAEAPELESDWDPRQEIIAIEERLFTDNIEAAPRKMTPNIPRINKAPDISGPVIIQSKRLLEEAEKLVAGPAWKGSSPSAEKIIVPDLGIPLGASLPENESDLVKMQVDEVGSLIDETADEVTDINAVEGLLGVNVISFIDSSDPDHVYFKAQIYRKGIEALPVLPKEVILIQDCSESMGASKLKQCRAGLHAWLESLRDGDTFNIITFRNSIDLCFPESRLVNAISRARARGFIENMEPRGKTDVHSSLARLLEIKRERNRPVIAVLVTDGRPTMGLLDSSEIIEQFSKKNAGNVSVFTMGGGTRVNTYLLDLLSYRNRGDSSVVTRSDEIPMGMRNFSGSLKNPVLAELDYRFSNLDESQVFPSSLTNLYLDRPLVLYGRAPIQSPVIAFQVVGRSGEKKHDMVFTLDMRTSSPGDSSLLKEWAWHKVYDLISIYTSNKDPDVLDQIVAICGKHGLDVPYAYTLDSPAKP